MRIPLGVLLLVLVTGCSSPQRSVDFEQASHDPDKSYEPKLAVILGGGGIKGFVHIGVIKAFEEEGIKPDFIVGTSIGSLAGALWSAGHSAAEMEQFALELENADLFDWTLLKAGGFLQGDRFESRVRQTLKGKKFSDLLVPFVAVATDLEKGQKTEFNQGDVAQAVRASSSVVGIFVPTQVSGRSYLDGDYVGTVPVESAKRRKAQIIFAVDVTSALPVVPVKSSSDIENRSMEILRRHQIDLELGLAHFVIRPLITEPFSYRQLMDRKKMIELGYQETKNRITELKSLLSKNEAEARRSPSSLKKSAPNSVNGSHRNSPKKNH